MIFGDDPKSKADFFEASEGEVDRRKLYLWKDGKGTHACLANTLSEVIKKAKAMDRSFPMSNYMVVSHETLLKICGSLKHHIVAMGEHDLWDHLMEEQTSEKSIKDQITAAFVEYNDCRFDGYEIRLGADYYRGQTVGRIGLVDCTAPNGAKWFIIRTDDGHIRFEPTLV